MRRTAVAHGVLLVCISLAHCAAAQSPSMWNELAGSGLQSYQAERADKSPRVRPELFRVFQLNDAAFAAAVVDAPLERLDLDPSLRPAPDVLAVPMPDGSLARFAYVESPVMHAELAAELPGIRTYVGQGIDDPAATIRFDKTPQGFHAQILSPNGAVYIDPYFDSTAYAVYRKADFMPADKNFVCTVLEEPTATDTQIEVPILQRSGSQLRTYRLAMACTGEYAAFHGGTIPGAAAAIVTTVNRVNGIYENELAVRMELIASNSDLIFLNAATDGYSNNDGFAMLGQNQTKINAIIGSAGYDIGHVVSTGGGGVAYLGSVCDNSLKAGGVTGSGSPVGDAFDVDYVAHEVGHQFGGSHTFNSVTGACNGNRTASAAYEPGSGSTIQAYAGICGSDDLQPHSDPYFHSYSFDQMFTFASNSACAAVSSTGNTAPDANAGPNYSIPKNTPFKLTGSGSDANGDTLSYCWEQRDLGPAAALSAADQGTIPLFRSLNATTSPSRTFPKWATILANVTDSAEKLPQLSRTMDFRLTVRDNRAGGGGIDTDDMAVNAVSTAGPFVVTSPNSAGTHFGEITVTWNVANTNASPVSTSQVDIILSTDGGLVFDTVLANNTPNDGSQLVTLPDVDTDLARVMVRAEGNIYFDVSNANFQIHQGTPVGDPETFTSTDVPKAISTSSTVTITSTLTVPDTMEIADVNAELNISHTWDEDLIASLTSPEGTVVTLFNAIGASGDNFTNTVLDDEAATSITAGTPPFTGTFRPQTAFSAFDAEDAQGTWTLTIQDTFAEDGGSLNSWSITVTPTAPPFDPNNVYVDFSWTGSESGTADQPFDTLTEGLNAAAEGGTVWITPGSSEEIGAVDQVVTLRINGVGVVVVGDLP